MISEVQGRLSFEESPKQADESDGGDAAADAAEESPVHSWVEAGERDQPGSVGAAEGGKQRAGSGRAEKGEREESGSVGAACALSVVRVMPDVVRLDKAFDYAVPEAWRADGRAERLTVGSIVRIVLGGRRMRGWITALGVEPPPGVALQPLAKLTGMGPPEDVMSLAGWAAWRWAGHRVSLLRVASPPRSVALPAARQGGAARTAVAGSRSDGKAYSPSSVEEDGIRETETAMAGPRHTALQSGGGATVAVPVGKRSESGDCGWSCQPVNRTERAVEYDGLFERPGAVSVVRCPPAGDAMEVARAAARRGDALIVTPGLADARRIAAGLRREGVRVALGFDDWARAAAGATVVGTRTAAWMPMPRLAAVVVFDEHAESLQSEQAPTWHARDVALERARRARAPAVLVSPVPTLEALEAGELATVGRQAERDGWPAVEVLDRRSEDPVRSGLFAEGLRDRLAAAPGRVAAVLNRKGRGRLLACKACGELARTADGRAPMRLEDDALVAVDGSERRPVVCAQCGSTVLRILRMGVTRAREELAALVGEPVGEVTADTGALGSERIMIGTEAVLWRLESAAIVVFLDFDQELLAPRQRAAEHALALLARAARLTGGRRDGGRLLVQTRQPDHPVVEAAVRADPSILASVERDRRQALGLPPYGAQAKVSGAGAESFAEALRAVAGAFGAVSAPVSIMGPFDGQFLLRARSHEPLLDLLAAVPRPAERLRVEVDPLRV